MAGPARWLELGVLVVANLAATVLRFLLLRHWVFRRRTGAPAVERGMTTLFEAEPGTGPAGRRPRHRCARAGPAGRGRAGRPGWVRPGLLALLGATAVLYLWHLADSGWANAFYSAAVQAGSQSWKAFFFGSSDAANAITVDKPPAALWVMELSARVFGFSAWSVLVPQALEGVAAVGLLHLTVRRSAGPAAGLLAGAVLATTPVAALMFRFNNPDSLLVLLLVGSVYCVVRALEHGSHPLAARRRRVHRRRLPHQAAAGGRRRAGARRSSTCTPRRPRCADGWSSCSRAAPPSSCPRAGGSPPSR